jgi:hypothetical protein
MKKEKMERGEMSELKMETKEYGMKVAPIKKKAKAKPKAKAKKKTTKTK